MVTKKRKDVGCPNAHLRHHICLTPKQMNAIISSLRSTATLRSTEKERAYLRQIIKKLHTQEGLEV